MHTAFVRHIIGIDEAGRGPLAGPVAVGAVAVPVEFPNTFFAGIRDSKLLPQHKREAWFDQLSAAKQRKELNFALSFASSQYIDRYGIQQAVKMALYRAIRFLQLDPRTTLVLLDGGLRAPQRYRNQRTIIGGDRTEQIIAAASIVAKVQRDRVMRRLSYRYPEYGFEQHKGYGTQLHYKKIRVHGMCAAHRQRFVHV